MPSVPRGARGQQQANPEANFDTEGNATIQLADATADTPRFLAFRRAVERGIPSNLFDWDEPSAPSALQVHWLHARLVVSQFVTLWPETTVTAAANPWFGKGAELTALVADQLAAIETAADLLRDAGLVRPAGVRQ